MMITSGAAPECKFHRPESGLRVDAEGMIEGHASLFGVRDQGGDVVEPGACAASLARLAAAGGRVRMLWQHDPGQPIGIWDLVREDDRGLFVRGRLLEGVARGREARALIEAGAIDGLSIGYRTLKAKKGADGLRHLHEIELWEVSLVTFPMLENARVARKADGALPEAARLAAMLDAAALGFRARR